MKRSPLIPFFLAFLALSLTQCAHQPKRAKDSKSASQGPSGGISDKGNDIYYFLVSQLESLEGKEESSLFYLNKSIKKSPDSSYLLLQKAYRFARDNKIDDAFKTAREATKKNPNAAGPLLLLGKLHTTKGQSEEAIAHYQRALEREPANEEAHMLLAREYVADGQNKKAIALLRKMIQLNPEAPESYFYLGSIYATQEKNYDEALKVYQGILELYPDDPRILQVVAELYLAQKNFPQALDVLLRLRELGPTDLNLNVRIGLLYYELKNIDAAIDAFRRIHQMHPKSDRIAYYLGLLHHEKKDNDDALRYFAMVPPASEFYADAVTRQVVILRFQDRNDAALALARQALERNAKVPEFYDLLSSLYSMSRDFTRALEVVNRGIAAFPDSEKLIFAKGVVYEKMNETDKSLEAMKRVVELNPENVLALNFIGYTYAEQGRNLEEAEVLIEKALKLKPNDGFIIDSLGWVYYQKGDLNRALGLIEKANRLSPNEPTILEHLGDIHLKRQNKLKARTYLEQSLFILRKKEEKDAKDLEQLKRVEGKIGGL